MQRRGGKHVLFQHHGNLGTLFAWLLRERFGVDLPHVPGLGGGLGSGWGGCGVGDGSSRASLRERWKGKSHRLCQRPGRGSTEAKASQPDVLQKDDP